MKKRLLSIFLILCIISSLLVGCGSKETARKQKMKVYMLQEYEAVANGFGGVIRLKVEVDANKIISVDVLESSETEGIGTRAIEDMPQMFIDANSTDIDIIAGCTVTSNAMKEMVQNARNQAMGLSLSSELNMKGGVYKPIVRSYAEVNGLATGDGSMTIEVTIEDNNIKNIDVLD